MLLGGALGSGMAARILDFSEMGLPNLLLDLAARRSRLATSALLFRGQHVLFTSISKTRGIEVQ